MRPLLEPENSDNKWLRPQSSPGVIRKSLGMFADTQPGEQAWQGGPVVWGLWSRVPFLGPRLPASKYCMQIPMQDPGRGPKGRSELGVQ